MDSYFAAKMRLFEELLPRGKPAVIWTDDPKSDEVIGRSRRAALRRSLISRRLARGCRGDHLRVVEFVVIAFELGPHLGSEGQGLIR